MGKCSVQLFKSKCIVNLICTGLMHMPACIAEKRNAKYYINIAVIELNNVTQNHLEHLAIKIVCKSFKRIGKQ